MINTSTYRISGDPVLIETCSRCSGRGVIPRFGHVLKGVCFQCNGATVVPVSARKAAQILNSIERMATGRKRAKVKLLVVDVDRTGEATEIEAAP